MQSVALRLICDREHEIEGFVTREYWDITLGMLSTRKEAFTARLTHFDGAKLEKFSIDNHQKAEEIAERLKKSEYQIATIEKKQQKRHPQPPFTTSSMQQEAARKLGFSAKKTMQVAQKLYEGIDIGGETTGLITYMRTDGVSLSLDAVEATRSWITSNFGDKYLPSSPRIYKAKAKNAQEAHEAIRPTESSRTPDQLKGTLDSDQYKLYDLIWKRMIACQMESVVMDIVTACIDSLDKTSTLRAVGSTIAFDGFYKIYREDTDDSETEENRLLPVLNEGEKTDVVNVAPAQHFTEPPPRYTEASLVKKLEELGIGRPSTWAPIISVLQERDYVKLDKKRFIPEDRGMLVTAFLANSFAKYVEYDFTAGLENELDEVAAGSLNWKALLSKFWQGFNENVAHVSQYKITDVINQLEEVLGGHLFPAKDDTDPRKCTACENGKLGLKLGKYGAFIACSNYPECKFTKQIAHADSSESEGVNVDENNKSLGRDADGSEVYLKKGPYGWYVQAGEAASKTDKPKRSSLPPHILPQNVDLSVALTLLSLPKILGNNPETGEEVLLGVGKFGPYVKHAGKFTSIPKGEDFLSVDLNRAVEIIKTAPQKRKNTKE